MVRVVCIYSDGEENKRERYWRRKKKNNRCAYVYVCIYLFCSFILYPVAIPTNASYLSLARYISKSRNNDHCVLINYRRPLSFSLFPSVYTREKKKHQRTAIFFGALHSANHLATRLLTYIEELRKSNACGMFLFKDGWYRRRHIQLILLTTKIRRLSLCCLVVIIPFSSSLS